MDIRTFNDDKNVSVSMTMSQFIAIRDVLFELQYSQCESDATKNLARILGDDWVLPDVSR